MSPRSDTWPELVELPDGRRWERCPTPGRPSAPSYRLMPQGSPGRATGRVWIRLAAGRTIAGETTALEAAGFVVDAAPAWAPQAAWLRPRSGQDPDAMTRLPRLAALAGVEFVEPELERPRSPR